MSLAAIDATLNLVVLVLIGVGVAGAWLMVVASRGERDE